VAQKFVHCRELAKQTGKGGVHVGGLLFRNLKIFRFGEAHRHLIGGRGEKGKRKKRIDEKRLNF
jgi:hypothetical protein